MERQVVQAQQVVQKQLQLLVDVLQWQVEEIRHVYAQQKVLKMPRKPVGKFSLLTGAPSNRALFSMPPVTSVKARKYIRILHLIFDPFYGFAALLDGKEHHSTCEIFSLFCRKPPLFISAILGKILSTDFL